MANVCKVDSGLHQQPACNTCDVCIFLKKSMFRPIPPSSRTRTSPRQRTRSNSQVNLDSLCICVLISFNNQRWVVLPLEPFLVGGLPTQPWGQPHVLHPRPDVDRLCQVRMAGRIKKLTKGAQDRESNTRRVPAASALGFCQTRPLWSWARTTWPGWTSGATLLETGPQFTPHPRIVAQQDNLDFFDGHWITSLH